MLAKGLVLGKGALQKAKTLDERHQLISSAVSTVASLDRRIGLTEKISLGSAMVNEKVKEADRRFQVSEITKSAGVAVLSNRYVSTGASWVSAAFGKVAQTADDVAAMTREKLQRADEENEEMIQRQRAGIVADFAHIHLDDGPAFIHVEEHSADGGARRNSFSG